MTNKLRDIHYLSYHNHKQSKFEVWQSVDFHIPESGVPSVQFQEVVQAIKLLDVFGPVSDIETLQKHQLLNAADLL